MVFSKFTSHIFEVESNYVTDCFIWTNSLWMIYITNIINWFYVTFHCKLTNLMKSNIALKAFILICYLYLPLANICTQMLIIISLLLAQIKRLYIGTVFRILNLTEAFVAKTIQNVLICLHGTVLDYWRQYIEHAYLVGTLLRFMFYPRGRPHSINLEIIT